jgi:hypothetical protein
LLIILQERFRENTIRHGNLTWIKIQDKLENAKNKLWSLYLMEFTGGAPDVVGYDKETDEYIFNDCSAEIPKERTNVCYDRKGQEEREKKGVYPNGNAIDICKSMGTKILTQEEYRELQKLGEFDTKTSSWLKTPEKIRNLGGAIFGDRRYNTVFIYHNGAKSFYSVRGFRSSLRV